ncbi:MAG: acetyl-CoA carboxylase, biotin carboxyl carrier protein [Armatimonadota bacterium]|jgi:acetyl-CoA carboxylase biotin carboxyl carrier protein|nr:acetyl-CoA carboxylase, biotin carboxyl carrier protein [Armatimonadota bacterium]
MEAKQNVLSLETVRALVRLMETNSLSELTVEDDGYSITLRAESAQPAAAAAPLAPQLSQLGAQKAEDASLVPIVAPMTGVFYRSPAPGEPPFVEVGDMVEEGQVIGLIEAMKVFSEVPADRSGRVVAIPAKSGELVHQDQPLILLAPEGDGHGG